MQGGGFSSLHRQGSGLVGIEALSKHSSSTTTTKTTTVTKKKASRFGLAFS
jgi:hypothetical protein